MAFELTPQNLNRTVRVITLLIIALFSGLIVLHFTLGGKLNPRVQISLGLIFTLCMILFYTRTFTRASLRLLAGLLIAAFMALITYSPNPALAPPYSVFPIIVVLLTLTLGVIDGMVAYLVIQTFLLSIWFNWFGLDYTRHPMHHNVFVLHSIACFSGFAIITVYRRYLQKNLQEQQDSRLKARQAEQHATLGLMADGLSMEVHNPLIISMGSVSIIKRLYPEDEHPDLHRWVQKLETSLSRIEFVMRSVQVLSESYKLEERSVIPLQPLVKNLFERFHREIQEQVLTYEECVGTWSVRAHRVQIELLIRHLVTYALHHAKAASSLVIEVEERSDVLVLNLHYASLGVPGEAIVQSEGDEECDISRTPFRSDLGIAIAYNFARANEWQLKARRDEARVTFLLLMPYSDVLRSPLRQAA